MGFAEQFLATVERFPDRCALEIDRKHYSYGEIAGAALSLAAAIQRSGITGPVALMARHSAEAYQGLLGIFLSGSPYLPLNPDNPVERNLESLRRAGCRLMLIDRVGWEYIAPALGRFHAFTILRMDNPAPGTSAVIHVMPVATALDDSTWLRPNFKGDATAYIIFTSGSAGMPKGIRITNSNVHAAIQTIHGRMNPRETDRVSQLFELSFDGSLFGVFLAWTSGACLCPSSPRSLLPLRTFIQQLELTMWAMTPSIARLMRRLGWFDRDAFPSIRHSVFAGEPVTLEMLSAWSLAAPNSLIDNLYGPTEATILCTGYRWSPQSGATEAIAPIGSLLGDMKGKVVNSDLVEVGEGEAGELLLSGPHVTPGYLDQELTAGGFVTPFEPGSVYYRTGDLVSCVDGQLQHLGRLDYQIKVRGNRVELGEVEAQLRKFSGCARAVALAWPMSNGGADGIVGFVETDGCTIDLAALQRNLAAALPRYMLPSTIQCLRNFPTSSHGKIDRIALQQSLGPINDGRKGLIVLGIPRSGTTLLRRLLDGHPDLSCPGETYLLTACARFIQNDGMPGGIQVGVLEGLHHLGIDEEEVLERLRNHFFETHHAHAASKGKSYWAEKTAVDAFYIEEIERLIGSRARFVVLLRHGLDVAASLVELSQRVGGYYRELHQYIAQYRFPFEAFLRMWCDRTNALLDFAERRQSQVHILRYEDLVHDTERIMNGIFRFVGISEQMNLAERALKRNDSIGIGDWKAFQSTSVRNDRVGRQECSPGVLATMAGIVNPTLERAGYSPLSLAAPRGNGLERNARYADAIRLSRLVPRGLTNAK